MVHLASISSKGQTKSVWVPHYSDMRQDCSTWIGPLSLVCSPGTETDKPERLPDTVHVMRVSAVQHTSYWQHWSADWQRPLVTTVYSPPDDHSIVAIGSATSSLGLSQLGVWVVSWWWGLKWAGSSLGPPWPPQTAVAHAVIHAPVTQTRTPISVPLVYVVTTTLLAHITSHYYITNNCFLCWR